MVMQCKGILRIGIFLQNLQSSLYIYMFRFGSASLHSVCLGGNRQFMGGIALDLKVIIIIAAIAGFSCSPSILVHMFLSRTGYVVYDTLRCFPFVYIVILGS